MSASRGGRDRPSYEEFPEILRSIHNGQEGPVRRAADLRPELEDQESTDVLS